MTQVNLSKSVVIYSPNTTRLDYLEDYLKDYNLDLKLSSDLKEIITHLETFAIEKFIIDVDFKGSWEENLKIVNAIFTTYFYKFKENSKNKFVAIVHDEMMEEFLEMMGIPNQRNIEFEFEKFLIFEE